MIRVGEVKKGVEGAQERGSYRELRVSSVAMDLFDASHQAVEVEGICHWVREAVIKVQSVDGREV